MATTTQNGVVYANLGLKGSALAATSFTTAVASATTSLRDYANGLVSATQAAETDSAFATQVMTNLGLTAAVIGQAAYDALQPALAAYVNSVGVANRGVVVVQLSQIVAGLTGDATYGVAAINLNNGAASAYTYSTTAANTTDGAIAVIPAPVNFKLTTGADSPAMTAGDDTFDGSTLNTLSSTDTFADKTTTDKDVLNATVNTAPGAFTATNIETVNIKWASLSTATVDAANITGATINVDSDKLGFADVTVNNVGANAVTVDSSTTGTLTLTGIKSTTVNAGSATKLDLTGNGTTVTGYKDTATVTVSNDISNLTNGGNLDVLNLKASTAAKVTFNTGDLATVATKLVAQGTNALTVSSDDVSGATITNEITGAALNVISTQAGAIDLSKIDKTAAIELKGVANGNITIADGQTIKLSVDQTSGVFVGTGKNIDVALNSDQTALNVTALATVDFTTAKDTTITTLTTDADTGVTFAGANKVTVTTAGVSDVNASALTGKFTYNGADAIQGVTGSATAVNAITFGNITTNGTFTGGAEADTVDATALTTGSITISAGAGNDVVKVDNSFGAGKLVFTGGTGTDTLKTTAASNFTTGTLTLTDVEALDITTGTVFSGYQLNGKTYTVAGQATNSNFTVNSHATKDLDGTVDLSKLVLATASGSNIDAVTINGLDGSKDTLIGTSAIDTIDAGTSADTLTGGAGADVFVFNADDSTKTAIDKVTDYTVGASADKIDDVSGTVAFGVTNVDVSAADADGTATNIKANVTNGIITLSGTDAAKIDTLTEWLNVATTTGVITVSGTDADAVGTVGFVFGGDTYLVESNDASNDNTNNVQLDNVIQLVGISGASLVTTAAAGKILIG